MPRPLSGLSEWLCQPVVVALQGQSRDARVQVQVHGAPGPRSAASSHGQHSDVCIAAGRLQQGAHGAIQERGHAPQLMHACMDGFLQAWSHDVAACKLALRQRAGRQAGVHCSAACACMSASKKGTMMTLQLHAGWQQAGVRGAMAAQLVSMQAD